MKENVLPSRASIFLGTVFGLAALANLASASYQLAAAYFSGEGLDVTTAEFLGAGACFLLATYAATFQLRKICRQLGLLHGLRRRVVMAEYDPPCSPGVAGALLDGEFSLAEVKGMMIDLALQGYLNCEQTGSGELWTLEKSDIKHLPPSEQALIKELFGDQTELQLPGDIQRLRLAAKAVHDAVLAEARDAGLIKRFEGWEILRSIHWLLVVLGYGIIAIMFYELVWRPEEVFTIGYPRYPVELWKLLFLVFQIIIIAGVAGGAYVRSLTTARGLDLSTSVAGFYLFIRTVFADPAKYGAWSDLIKYYPYAVAFRLPAKLDTSEGTNWNTLLRL